MEKERKEMVDRLVKAGIIRDAGVRRAMQAVERHLFVPKGLEHIAYIDRPLGIGHDQTISAPHMVAIMVQALELRPGMKVLEVGGGSGYHAAVIAEMVRPGGKVFSVERIAELAMAARENLRRSGHDDVVEVVIGDGSKGLPDRAPFDRISVAAASPNIPMPLVDELAEGGFLIIPVGGALGQDLVLMTKKDGRLHRKSLGPVIFVPLVGEHGYESEGPSM